LLVKKQKKAVRLPLSYIIIDGNIEFCKDSSATFTC